MSAAGSCVANCKNMAEPDKEVFQIDDFTSVTEWEKFIDALGLSIEEWGLPEIKPLPCLQKDELSYCEWSFKSKEVCFAKFRFVLTWHFCRTKSSDDAESPGSSQDQAEPEEFFPEALRDVSNDLNDFPKCPHYVTYWYGLRNFLVLHPCEAEDAIVTEDRTKLLLSSLAVALNTTKCNIPAFVQLLSRQNKLFQGICEDAGLRINFDSVYFYRKPPNLQHVSGLLKMFKEKLGGCVDSAPVTITARSKYILSEWSLDSWPQMPFDVDYLSDDILPKDFGYLGIGAFEDPVVELQLYTCWPHLSEDVIIDNDIHSDFHPFEARLWVAGMRFAESPACSLADYLYEFVSISFEFDAQEKLIGGIIYESESTENSVSAKHALDKLAGPTLPKGNKMLSLTNVLHQAHKAGKRAARKKYATRKHAETPLRNPTLSLKILQFIFPDSQTPPEEDEEIVREAEESANKLFKETIRGMKSAPVDSLTWRLAHALAKVNVSFGGLQSLAQLWNLFVQEVNYRWEENLYLPSLENGPPDLSCCLLHQKLQMLNYCIERRRARENLPASTTSLSDDSDDEFFECNEAEAAEKPKRTDSTFPMIPDGRLRPLGNLTLLNSKDPLYIPITQEPAPLTEDALAEQAEALVRLGTDKEGANLRARLQSACLISDMQAFKAANPKSVLADFVRWYSPRDWIEEGEESRDDGSKDESSQEDSSKEESASKDLETQEDTTTSECPLTPDDEDSELSVTGGRLSGRMTVPGNIWMEAWDSTRPTPARKQKRLFDETKEAERVLHFLRNLTPLEIVNQLMPVLIQAAVLQLDKMSANGPPSVKQLLIRAIKLATSGREYLDVLQCLYQAELKLAQLQSIRTKFSMTKDVDPDENPLLTKFLQDLVDQPTVEVPGASKGILGKRIIKTFENNSENFELRKGRDCFPKAKEREFIFRHKSPQPTPGCSQVLPQKLYALLGYSEFRLCFAYSEDTTYF